MDPSSITPASKQPNARPAHSAVTPDQPSGERASINGGPLLIGLPGETAATETKDVLAEEQVLVDDKGDELYYRTYRSEAEDMKGITRLVDQELSEPYVPFVGMFVRTAEVFSGITVRLR